MNKKNTKFVRRLITSYSALLLILLVMGAYLYTISIDNVSREIRTQTQLSLEQSVGNMDNAFKTMDILAGQVVAISNINHLANSTSNTSDDFYIKAYNAKEELSVLAFTETVLPVKASNIHLKESNYILSFSEFNQTEMHYIGRNYRRDRYEQWLAMLNDQTLNRHFIPIDAYKSFVDSTLIYKLPLDEYTLVDVPATLFFEIDYSGLKSLFSELNLYESGYIYVTDEEGTMTFSIQGPTSIGIDEFAIKQLDFINNMASFKSGGKEMFITSAASDFNGWLYYLVQPADSALYSLTRYRNIFISVILAGILFEILLILYLSRSNVKRITQLGHELQDTITLQEDLMKVVETQKPVIQQSYLTKIIKGNIATDQELDYARQYLSIDSNNKKFSILYITAYINQYELYLEDAAVTIPEDLNYKDILSDSIKRFFGAEVNLYSPREGEYALLISSDIEEDNDISTSNVKRAFDTMHASLKSNYSIWTLAGLGNWHTGLMITWKSFQQAVESISYATKRDTFKCYNNIIKDTAGFYYPIELTNQLTNFINAGNESQVLEIFEIIRHENMEERSLPPLNIMKYLLSDVRNTLYKIRFTIRETEANSIELAAIDALFNQHMSLMLCEDIAVNLCKLSEVLTGNNELINTIRNYIDNHYKDPSLCLTKISDEFSISESYFSYLFKEEIGENFSSYLGRTRIEQAHQLIQTTDINVSEIYNEVGYNNSHSFRRAFKKIYGITPKEARIQSRSH